MQGSGIKFLDYDIGIMDFSSPEIKGSLEIYKGFQDSIPRSFGDLEAVKGAADIRDGIVLWVSPMFAMDGYILTTNYWRDQNF